MCKDLSFGTLIGSDTLNIQLAFPPSAPTITSLFSNYADQLTVTWTSVPTATSYSVSINDSVNTLVPIPSSGASQYMRIFTGLSSNTVYIVSVVAINCAGSSSFATISGRTTPPNAPNITSLISNCSNRLTVTWTSVPTATSYNVSINDSVNTLVPIPSTGSSRYMWNFTGLTNNTVYTVSVVAINFAGSSSPAMKTGKTGVLYLTINDMVTQSDS